MQGFLKVTGLSALVVVRKVEQRFGFAGYARLVKLLELISACGPVAEGEPIALPWADVLESLQAGDMHAREFLSYCEEAKALRVTRDAGQLLVTLGGELVALMASAPVVPAVAAGPVLFETDDQWAEWFAADLNCPPYLANDAATRYLFRRWCATNVTVAEVEAAVELAIKAKEAPLPAALHDYLKTVRNTKIERARR
ncbi:hypothetical protein [Pseudomonas sp. 3JA]|uniref:hypothetical protein n=1 Tax=Pseudomonas sp. 3JA TaxID=3109347 RepID=UPI003008FA7C